MIKVEKIRKKLSYALSWLR